MAQKPLCAKNDLSQSLTFAVSTKKIIFISWGPVKSSQYRNYDQFSDKNCNFTTYIKLGL